MKGPSSEWSVPSRLEMDCVAINGHRRLHHRLAQRRVGVDVATELPRIALEELCQRRLRDELGGVGPNDVRAQHLAGLGVGDDLDEAARLAVDLRAPDRREWKAANLYLVPVVASLLFGEADRGDLRVRVSAPGDQVLLHRSHPLTCNVLRGDDAFMRGCVRKQITADDIPDGVDGFDGRAHPLVDLDESVRVRLDADLLQAELLRDGGPSHGHQQLLGPDLSLVGLYADPVACFLRAAHLDSKPAVDARLLERGEHLLRDVLVLERHQTIERLEQSHLDAELVVERRELDPDCAGADDADRFRRALGEDGVVGGDDELTVQGQAGEGLDRRPRRDDEVLRLDRAAVDVDRVAIANAALALDHLDLVLLHQVLDALVEMGDDGVAALGDARVVIPDNLGLEAVLGAPAGDPVVQLGSLVQGLGGDTADVQACPAQLARLDQGHFQAQLRGADGGWVTTPATTQDRDVEIELRHCDQ